MMQYFEWYLDDDGQLWNRLKEDAKHLKELGITAVWTPPAYKATGTNDTGYGVYDLYDLGEFDQKGAVRTKYGTKAEYLAAIEALHAEGIAVYADVVLNHKAGADETERFLAYEVNPDKRQEKESKSYEIEGWTKFTFPGRGDKYSDFKWSWEHFNGTDYNIDYGHPAVVEEVKKWADWYIKETGVDGFRLDAVKHINDQFVKDFVETIRAQHGDDFYVVGEYWKYKYGAIKEYLEATEFTFDLFDVALHQNFHVASQQGKDYDLRELFKQTLIAKNPTHAVTFVDNHDSQPDQALQSFVEPWFKPLAYGVTLLREQGFPCLFYGDYYGIKGANPIDGQKTFLDKLLYLRANHAYGEQRDYFDHGNCVGWTRLGNEEHPYGLATVLSNSEEGFKDMYVGEQYAGQTFADYTGNREDKVEIGEDGNGRFPVNAGSISVWVKDAISPEEAFDADAVE